MPGSSEKQRPAIGVGVLVWHEDKLLLGERLHPRATSCWQFPGGHLEYAENVLDCARREVREETGLEIHQLKTAGYTEDVFISAQRHYITLYVSARLLRGEPEVKEPEKCACWQWFLPSQLPTPLFTPISNLLKAHPDLAVLA
ncbi:MAG: NUDIX domain-containing protein [Gammaproteobacteria bacterium]